jgi:iron(III) transport system substrate-binding protein
VNAQYVRPEDITSWRELLDPKYRGRISAYDPTVAGQGFAPAAYLLRMLGEDYVRAIYHDQQPGLTRDYRQIADWMAHGTHPVSLGVSSRDADALRRDGFPVQRVRELPEAPSTVSAGFGLLVLVNRAPNPNAAKLFVNWIATREGAEVFSRADGTVSARADVDSAAWAPADAIPRPDVQYFDSFGWEYTLSEFTPEKLERMRRIVGRT